MSKRRRWWNVSTFSCYMEYECELYGTYDEVNNIVQEWLKSNG